MVVVCIVLPLYCTSVYCCVLHVCCTYAAYCRVLYCHCIVLPCTVNKLAEWVVSCMTTICCFFLKPLLSFFCLIGSGGNYWILDDWMNWSWPATSKAELTLIRQLTEYLQWIPSHSKPSWKMTRGWVTPVSIQAPPHRVTVLKWPITLTLNWTNCAATCQYYTTWQCSKHKYNNYA